MYIGEISKKEKRQILRANRGLLSRVARELDVQLPTVSRTFWAAKNGTSARVETALLREIAKVRRKT